MTQVSTGDAFKLRELSLNIFWSVAPITPSPSTIQNNINEPTRGVTIIGRRDAKIVGPFNNLGRLLTPRATKNQEIKQTRVTTKV